MIDLTQEQIKKILDEAPDGAEYYGDTNGYSYYKIDTYNDYVFFCVNSCGWYSSGYGKAFLSRNLTSLADLRKMLDKPKKPARFKVINKSLGLESLTTYDAETLRQTILSEHGWGGKLAGYRLRPA